MRRLIIITTLCSLTLAGGWAQKQKPKNQPYADMKWYHLGFHIGLHTQDLILTHNGIATPDGETWYAEVPVYSPGFTVGVLGDLYLNRYFSLRLSPTVHFGDKQFTFLEQTSKTEFITSVRSNYLIIPLDVKYAAVRLNNYRPYLIGGVYSALDIGRKRGNPLLLKGSDYGVEFGFGCDIYLPFFKLCPEIKFCFGLADVLEKNRSDLINEADRKYSQALSRATSRMIVFTFNFE
ncbi:MAG: PorT family protein [Tannerella sp.]|nr:PorT family protein [Tannerella sp.]